MQCITNFTRYTSGYNFMPWSFRVGRTSYEVPIRGGALSSEWQWSDFDDTIQTEEGESTHAMMWANLEYFLKAVVPAAEDAGVYLACHPGSYFSS